MTQIKQLVLETTSDLRGGRQSWRVLGMLWSVALFIAVAAAAVPH
jgi:predicted cobalt transporter CbtA